jgi:hypothetical protein
MTHSLRVVDCYFLLQLLKQPTLVSGHKFVFAPNKKAALPFVAMTMVTFGSPAFLDQRIRDFLSLPYDRFGFSK